MYLISFLFLLASNSLLQSRAARGAVAEVAAAVVVPAAEAVNSTGTPRPVKRTLSPPSPRVSSTHSLPSDSEKKIHQSWGGDDGNSELKTEQAAAIDATAEATTNDWSGEAAAAAADWGAAPAASADAWGAAPEDAAAAPAAEGEAKEGRPRREREPEEDDNTLTLDQYLAQQKEKEAAVPKIEGTRAANDGADDVFKDAVPLSKNADEDAYFVGKVCLIPPPSLSLV